MNKVSSIHWLATSTLFSNIFYIATINNKAWWISGITGQREILKKKKFSRFWEKLYFCLSFFRHPDSPCGTWALLTIILNDLLLIHDLLRFVLPLLEISFFPPFRRWLLSKFSILLIRVTFLQFDSCYT